MWSYGDGSGRDEDEVRRKSMVRRKALRRLDAGPFIIVGLLWLGMPLGLLVNWPLPVGQLTAVAMAMLGVTAVVYLGGPTGKIKVLPDRLVVDNTFNRVVVPRHLLDSVQVLDVFGVHLLLTDNERIPVLAAMVMSTGSMQRSFRQLNGKAREVTELIDSVPRSASTGEVRKQLRVANLMIACFAAVGLVGSFVYIVNVK
jgi:hypothetical protein